MIEKVEKEIDGHVYEYMPLMAKAARSELDKLIQKFGPAISKAIGGMKSIDVDADVDLEKGGVDALVGALPAIAGGLAGAIDGFSSSLSPEYHRNLVDCFLKRVTVHLEGENGQPIQQQLTSAFCEQFFATRLLTETKVLIFCLESQYADFFELWGSAKDALGALKARARSSSGSPKA
jgi:hypothetical protein